jgi:hypothetical protein
MAPFFGKIQSERPIRPAYRTPYKPSILITSLPVHKWQGTGLRSCLRCKRPIARDSAAAEASSALDSAGSELLL